MFLVFILGLLVLICEFIGNYIRPFHVFGYTFPPAVFFLPIISPLRDLIQERRQRAHAFIAMGLAVLAFYFTTPLKNAEAAAAALIWVELVDFAFYTYFRRFGWGIGVVLSDLISVPLLLPLYIVFLGHSPHIVPLHFFVGEFVVLVLAYIVILITPIRKLFTGLPMIGKRSEE